jgi:hypothetical protein
MGGLQAPCVSGKRLLLKSKLNSVDEHWVSYDKIICS